MSAENPIVSIVMGSDSDIDTMKGASDALKKFGVNFEMIITSAHRTPKATEEFAKGAASRGIKVIIAGAGFAAHLAGVIASHTVLPIIGVPLDASSLNGLDSLLAIVQMPSGIPVATVTIGKAGAKNAAILAVEILALSDKNLTNKLLEYRKDMAEKINNKNKKLND